MKNLIKVEYKRAVIYCRVSSERQVNEGSGLESQELRCEKKANELNLEVAATFRDPAVSGKLFDRPAMNNLIEFLDDHPSEKFVIIFDDLKRFARGIEVHLKFKTELVIKRKAKLECLNFKFEDTPGGRFVETVMAGAAQLEREQNAEQVMNKMRACLERGHWCFNPPPGLKNIKGVLSPVEPYASIFKEAIEKFQNFELNTYQAVQEFILAKYQEQGINKTISLNGVYGILTEPLYAGHFEYQPWGVSFRKSEHHGFISLETYQSVQERIQKATKPRLRKDYNIDFPLRGYALCKECGRPLTAAWFKGRTKRVPYYLCKTLGCLRKNKAIPKENLENDFVGFLGQVAPRPEILRLAEAVLDDMWQSRARDEGRENASVGKKVEELKAQNQTYFIRISRSQSESVIVGYEEQIEQNEKLMNELRAGSCKVKYSQDNFQTAVGVVLEHFKNPVKQWQTGSYHKRRLLLGVYFEKKMTYEPGIGFQTSELPLILELCRLKTTSKNHLVEMPGVKPGSKTYLPFNYSQD